MLIMFMILFSSGGTWRSGGKIEAQNPCYFVLLYKTIDSVIYR